MSEFPYVERDGADWPKNLPTNEQVKLIEVIKMRLGQLRKPVGLSGLYYYIKDRDIGPTFNKAQVLDWRYACIERALREVAEPVWQLKE